MTGLIFIILFVLNFVTSPCQGEIFLPPGGNRLLVKPGTPRVEIAWTFDDIIDGLTLRQWDFVTKKKRLGVIFGNGEVTYDNSSALDYEILKPGTLVLKNVDDSYNGTYEFSISTVTPESYVNVFIAVSPSLTINCSDPIIVNEGNDVRCLCKGEGGNPPANVTWYKDGNQIGVAGHEEKWLTLNNVNETNNGTYNCVAQSYTLKANKSINIIVHVKPKVTSLTFSPKVVDIGENVTIECKASGYPAPSYTITLNHTRVLSNEMMYELTNLNSSHTGSIITCTATNIVGSDSQSKGLPLKARPSVGINCSSTITVNESDSVRCLCEGKGGYPPANVTWYDKDGQMIGDVGNEKQMLTLNNVNETNNGTYRCVAQSYNLPADKSIKVIVHFKPKVTSLTLSPKVVYIGENVTIECKASGFPAPSYTIVLNHTLVLSNQMMYELTNLNSSDAGSIITCNATNIVGSDSQSKVLPLKVRPNVAINCSSTITVNERDSVRCLCEGKGGYPPANVTWYDKDGKMISDARDEENMLSLDNIDETKIGTYKCVAQSYNLQANETIKIIFHVRAESNKSTGETKWYVIVVVLLAGIIIAIILSYIFVCSRRRFRNRKPQSNPEPETSNVNSAYQDLDLSKMNSEDNYQSLKVNSGRSDGDYENQNDSTYTELNKVRDVEDNYQSLT